jgi:hypothetical protein
MPLTARKDPGSYTVQDEPFDTWGATKVPLRTPHGPVTLTLPDAGHIMCDAGYVTAEWEHAANYSGGEWFSWDGIEVAGSANFHAETGWAPRDSLTHLYSRGGSVTPRRETGILAYWGEVVRRYAAEHPHVLAHAGLRAAVANLSKQDTAIHEAETALAELRSERTRAKRAIRQALAAAYRTGGPDSPDSPRPYRNEPVSGYVAELVNNRDFMVTTGTISPRQEPGRADPC